MDSSVQAHGAAAHGSYAELVAATNFSFLRGASHPFEMVAQAAGLGLSGIGICDRNSLSGVVRAYSALKYLRKDYPEFRLVLGSRIVFSDGTPDIAVYPTDRDAYGRLAALLTLGNRRAPKGQCHLQLGDLVEHAEGQLMIVVPRDGEIEHDVGIARLLAHGAKGRVWVAATYRFDGLDRARLGRLAAACASAGLPMLATTDALYHEPGRRIVQDVPTSTSRPSSASGRISTTSIAHTEPSMAKRAMKPSANGCNHAHPMSREIVDLTACSLLPLTPREIGVSAFHHRPLIRGGRFASKRPN